MAEAYDSRIHVVDQSGQPYGSVRRCCNMCGVMIVDGMRYTETIERWRQLAVFDRCDDPRP